MQKTPEQAKGVGTAVKERRAQSAKGLVVAAAVPVFILLIYAVLSTSKQSADAAAKYFSAPARRLLGTLFSVSPFSVMEIVYILFGLWVIAFIALGIRHVVRGRGHRLRSAARRVFTLVLVLLYIFAGYSALWGIEHNGYSFSEESGFYSPGVLTDDLISVTALFLKNANALAADVARDENGVYSESLDKIFAEYKTVYDSVAVEFPVLNQRSLPPKKMYIFSEYMSITGFTGIYFPFTGESNINIKAPPAGIPATIAHELAHQRGIASEAECNFVGITASVTSGIASYEYSGWFLGLTYLMNALRGADADAWRELRNQFGEGLEADWNYNNEYWAAYDSPVSTVSASAYDSYLKAHGHEDGIKSYGACVDLLVEYFKEPS